MRDVYKRQLANCADTGEPEDTTPFVTLEPAGDVAQLEEHLLCKQGVVGSSPIVSTEFACAVTFDAAGKPLPN